MGVQSCPSQSNLIQVIFEKKENVAMGGTVNQPESTRFRERKKQEGGGQHTRVEDWHALPYSVWN
jgi:hypothetical protein